MRLRKRKTSRRDSKTNETKEIETKKSESNDKTKNETTSLTIFFINALDLMIKSLNANDDNDENDCVASENSKTMSEDVNEKNDEFRSKKRTMKVVFQFFFLHK